ncbi:MAG: hypothetical protein AAGA48_09425 [Myxococcota bacterium]
MGWLWRAWVSMAGALVLVACGEAVEPSTPSPTVRPNDCGVVWEGTLTEKGVRNELGTKTILREAKGGWVEHTFRLPGTEVDRFFVEGDVEFFARRPGGDDPNLETERSESPSFVIPVDLESTTLDIVALGDAVDATPIVRDAHGGL